MAPSILHQVSQLFGKNDDSSWPIQDISTDKHQSRDAFPSIPHNSPVGDILTNILAFRTITKLFSQIQQEQPFIVLQAKPLDNQCQELLRLSLSEDKVKREVQVWDFKLQPKEFF